MSRLELKHPLVSVDWLRENIEAENLIVLDASIPKVAGNQKESKPKFRIPNTRFFDIKGKFSDVSGEFPNTFPSEKHFQYEARKLGVNSDSAIIVYDNLGIYSSARAWWLFKTFGHQNIAVLDGGLPEWERAGYEVANYSDEVYKKGNFEAQFHSELITNFVGVNEYTKDVNTIIIDARSEQRFQCIVPEPRAGLRSGTIPNSINLPYTELLNGNTFKELEEICSIFNTLIAPKKSIVVSCGTGITACILALAATLCGYKDLVLYDGSWTEYGSLTT